MTTGILQNRIIRETAVKKKKIQILRKIRSLMEQLALLNRVKHKNTYQLEKALVFEREIVHYQTLYLEYFYISIPSLAHCKKELNNL